MLITSLLMADVGVSQQQQAPPTAILNHRHVRAGCLHCFKAAYHKVSVLTAVLRQVLHRLSRHLQVIVLNVKHPVCAAPKRLSFKCMSIKVLTVRQMLGNSLAHLGGLQTR